MYAMLETRPDLAVEVGVVCWFMSNPYKTHWEAVQWILRYLVIDSAVWFDLQEAEFWF